MLQLFDEYPGIIVLITSRSEPFSENLLSRVDVPLYIAPPDFTDKLEMWRAQLQRICSKEKVEVDFNDLFPALRSLAEKEMFATGRSIDQICRSAIRFASLDGKSQARKLLPEHLISAAKTFETFRKYVKESEKSAKSKADPDESDEDGEELELQKQLLEVKLKQKRKERKREHEKVIVLD